MALGSRVRFSVAFRPSGRWKADELKVFGLVRVWEGERSFVEALDEVNFPLVLPGFGGLDGPTLSAEGHVPALIFSVLESSVVVLQDDLGEDAVPSSAIRLRETEKKPRVISLNFQLKTGEYLLLNNSLLMISYFNDTFNLHYIKLIHYL